MRAFFLITSIVITASCSSLAANELVSQDCSSLPRGLAPSEIGMPLPHTDDPTPPPDEPVRTIAEWEEVEAILFRWGDHNYLLSQIIDYVVDVTRAYIVVSSMSQASSCQSYLLTQGVSPIDSVEFLVQATNSVWIRDYAPWWLWRLDSWDLAMYEWDYNRPRPLDDVIPEWLSQLWGIEYYGIDLTHTGGNWLIDGQGNAYCSELILAENWGLTAQGVNGIFHHYCDIDTLPLTPMFFGIDHLNMSAKLLNDHTVLVNEFPSGSPYNAAMEATAEMFSSMTNMNGTPFKVIRIPTPNWSYSPYTYCNTLIVQNKVLVPTYNMPSYDDGALEIFRENMPGYEVHGINCSSIISLSGAINCITSNVPHPSLIHIQHAPLSNTLNTTEPYTVSAEIVSLGNLNPDSMQVIWRNSVNQQWSTITLNNTAGSTFEADIPPCPGGYVDYFIYAKNYEGNWTTAPRYGPEAHYTFHAGAFPLQVTVTPQNPPIIIPAGGGSFDCVLEVENNGTYDIAGEIWIEVDLPAGGTYLITKRDNFSIAANSVLSRLLTQVIPGYAPPGYYTYRCRIGDYPDQIYTEDDFIIEKRAGNALRTCFVQWSLRGWGNAVDHSDEDAIVISDGGIIVDTYPNPFNPVTSFFYTLPVKSIVNLSIYNISGRRIATLINGWREAGRHGVSFNASDLPSGIYLYEIRVGGLVNHGKILLMK